MRGERPEVFQNQGVCVTLCYYTLFVKLLYQYTGSMVPSDSGAIIQTHEKTFVRYPKASSVKSGGVNTTD